MNVVMNLYPQGCHNEIVQFQFLSPMSEFSVPSDSVRQQALASLTQQLVQQGHPEQYAQQMAVAAIFQADLVSWLKQNHPDLHQEGLALVEQTREEFEQKE